MDIKEIIKNIHGQWVQAKRHLESRCRATGQTEMADKLAACEMFKGAENLEGIVELFTSAQGIEFCLAAHFPTLSTLRLFKPHNVERFGIYIDAGEIELKNPRRAVLIGRTQAKLIYTEQKPLHKVVALKGASVTIKAEGWSVVALTAERGCQKIIQTSGNAIVLC